MRTINIVAWSFCETTKMSMGKIKWASKGKYLYGESIPSFAYFLIDVLVLPKRCPLRNGLRSSLKSINVVDGGISSGSSHLEIADFLGFSSH